MNKIIICALSILFGISFGMWLEKGTSGLNEDDIFSYNGMDFKVKYAMCFKNVLCGSKSFEDYTSCGEKDIDKISLSLERGG